MYTFLDGNFSYTKQMLGNVSQNRGNTKRIRIFNPIFEVPQYLGSSKLGNIQKLRNNFLMSFGEYSLKNEECSPKNLMQHLLFGEHSVKNVLEHFQKIGEHS